MRKNIIFSLLILISFFAGALLFAWKPLAITAINQYLAVNSQGKAIQLLDVHRVRMTPGMISAEEINISIDQRLQKIQGVSIRFQLSNMLFHSIAIEKIQKY